METIIFYTSLLLVFITWFRWRWKKTCLFQEMNIPGPKPSFWFGNLLELYDKGPLECEKEWFEKYGKVVGYYYGMKPILLVADTELLKKIFIKDFNLFTDRPEAVPLRFKGIVDYILPTRTLFDSLLVNLKGQRWKEVRKILNPTFSSNKLKLVTPIMKKAIETAVANVAANASSGNVFDIHDVFRRLTLDIICQTAFAVKINIQNDPHDEFYRSAKLMMSTHYKSKLMLLGMSFPEVDTFFMILNFVYGLMRNKGMIPPLKVTWMIGDVIKKRRMEDKEYLDLLQLMINASSSDVDSNNSNTISDEPLQKTAMRLTDKEIQANSLLVFLAGYETTSTVLGYIFHLLVKYPEHQQAIRVEIQDMLDEEGEISYSSVSKLKLLDRFFLESMRMYPPVTKFINRIALSDVRYGDLRIAKGVQVQFPIYYIHNSEEFWPNPEVFDPDRFLPENRGDNFNVTYVPFGIGPRNCLGIRFATMEAKLAIAQLLHHFEFISAEKDPKLKIEMKLATRVPESVFVKARPIN